MATRSTNTTTTGAGASRSLVSRSRNIHGPYSIALPSVADTSLKLWTLTGFVLVAGTSLAQSDCRPTSLAVSVPRTPVRAAEPTSTRMEEGRIHWRCSVASMAVCAMEMICSDASS